MKQEYILESLNCPNCAAKIEADVGKLPHGTAASLNLKKQTLTLETREDAFDAVERIVHRYEPDVKVRLKGGEQAPEQEFDVKKMLLRMALGAVVFAASILLGGKLPLYIIAYVILGYDVVLGAVKNII